MKVCDVNFIAVAEGKQMTLTLIGTTFLGRHTFLNHCYIRTRPEKPCLLEMHLHDNHAMSQYSVNTVLWITSRKSTSWTYIDSTPDWWQWRQWSIRIKYEVVDADNWIEKRRRQAEKRKQGGGILAAIRTGQVRNFRPAATKPVQKDNSVSMFCFS